MRSPAIPLALTALLVAMPLAGCLSTLADLTGTKTEGTTEDTVTPNGETGDLTDGNGTPGNDTLPGKPPVARIRINAEDGALLFKSDFTAADRTATPVVVPKKMNLTLLAADSEALDGARLDAFEWTVTPGNVAKTGRSVTVPVLEPGIYMVQLKVTDNRHRSDTQMVHVGLMPEAFTVSTPFKGSIDAGANGQNVPAPGAHAFKIEPMVDGKAVKVTGLALRLAPETTAAAADFTLALSGPDGQIAKANEGSFGEGETLTLASVDATDLTAGVTIEGLKGDYTLTVEITYLEIVPGLTDGAGDGHHHSH